jgi:hypothetical protein
MATSRTRPRARAPSHSRPPANQVFSKKAICLSYPGAALSHTRFCRAAGVGHVFGLGALVMMLVLPC